MSKCRCETEQFGKSILCTQEEAVIYDNRGGKSIETGACCYHLKMIEGIITPYREQDTVVRYMGKQIYPR